MKTLGICLLLLSLLLCGCTEKPNAPEIPTTAYEEIKSIPNLVCHVSASDTDRNRVLTGDCLLSVSHGEHRPFPERYLE